MVEIGGNPSNLGVVTVLCKTYVVAERRKNYAFLKDCEEFRSLPPPTDYSGPSWFGFSITRKANAPVPRLGLLICLDENKAVTRLLFSGNLIRQPYMVGAQYRISGDLKNTDNVMNNTFWIGIQPSLVPGMLELSARKIERYLGVNF